MEKPKKERGKKYEPKVKTDKSFMELVKIAVNYKPQNRVKSRNLKEQ